MGKTKVHELAQKLGLEDEVLLERLQEAGVDVKSSKGILEEEDLRKFEAASAPVVEKIEEERITPGIIRRRRKEVPKPVTAAEEPAPAQAESAPAPPVIQPPDVPETPPVVSEEKAEEPVAEAPEEKTPAKAAPAKAEPPVEEPSAKEPAQEKPAAAQAQTVRPSAVVPKEAKVQRVTPSRAKILGRVELPQPPSREEPVRGERGAPRKEGPARPSGPRRQGEGPAGQRPGEGARGARPAPSPRPGRSAPAPGLPAGGEAFAPKEARGGKKKKKGKGADYSEAPGGRGDVARRRGKREVFEPERSDRLRRGKRAPKPTKKTEVTVSKAIKRIIRISDVITVGELAKRMGVKANDLIKELMRQGTMVTINHPLDFETAAILASEFNYEVENVAFDEETILEHASLKEGEEEKPEDLNPGRRW